MSPALSDLPVRKVTRALESVGFTYVRTKCSHAVYRNREARVAVIPLHGVVKPNGPIPGWFADWVEIEAKAASLRWWEPLLIPELLSVFSQALTTDDSASTCS